MEKVIGRCSRCGGNVTVPEAWYGTVAPTPQCQSCNGRTKQPVIEIEAPTTNEKKLLLE